MHLVLEEEGEKRVKIQYEDLKFYKLPVGFTCTYEKEFFVFYS